MTYALIRHSIAPLLLFGIFGSQFVKALGSLRRGGLQSGCRSLRRRRVIQAVRHFALMCARNTALICSVPVSTAVAQQRLPHLDTFALPSSNLRCKAVEAATRNAQTATALKYEFKDGIEPNDRNMKVAFDSAGSAISLVMEVWQQPSPEHSQEIVLGVQFTSDSASGLRYRLESDGSSVSAARKAGAPLPGFHPHEALSKEELAKARVLTRWLWEHRCGQDSRR